MSNPVELAARIVREREATLRDYEPGHENYPMEHREVSIARALLDYAGRCPTEIGQHIFTVGEPLCACSRVAATCEVIVERMKKAESELAECRKYEKWEMLPADQPGPIIYMGLPAVSRPGDRIEIRGNGSWVAKADFDLLAKTLREFVVEPPSCCGRCDEKVEAVKFALAKLGVKS